ncbi:MAG TPA: hypothetical protein VFI03_12605 [Solirubrobacterales bacterium]|nr:hypothetical protein [Solirubrobacterales bacterium]
MSILDDAIREHLELKRAHGADDAELKKLEDEAFGPPQRPDEPDPFAEAPTEFLVAPETGAGEDASEEGGRRIPNIADLQEAPEPLRPQEPTAAPEADGPDEPDDAPAEEEQPAIEQEAIADPGHSTEERHAIASQPTEIFDVEGQFEDAATEADAPSDEELADAEQAEPRLAPPAEEEQADEFDEFFSEQRLSDELNQALEAPLPDEPGAPATEEAAVFVDADEEEAEYEEEEAPEAEDEVAEEDSREFELASEGDDEDDAPEEPAPPAAASTHEDVLEDTPEFLEESPEDDNLWFEQKPPKDFDFDD